MTQSVWTLLAASVLLPPAGLVLLWLRSGTRMKDRIFGTVVIGFWSVAYLMIFFGLRFPLDGSGVRPIPTFGTPESRYAALERDRASAPPPAPATPVNVEAAAPP